MGRVGEPERVALAGSWGELGMGWLLICLSIFPLPFSEPLFSPLGSGVIKAYHWLSGLVLQSEEDTVRFW